MEKIIKIILSSLLVVICFSCNDLLEEEPQNKLKPETATDYDELLNYGYPTTRDYGTVVPLDYYVEMMTDDQDIRYFNQVSNEYPIHPFSFESTHEHSSMMGGYDMAWKNFYQAIFYANVVIEDIDKAQGSESFKKYIKGEAMALRAFSYFKLINLYAMPYDEDSADSDLGVPLKLSSTVQSESYKRNSVKEIYEQIDKDLKEGISLMEGNNQNVESKFKLKPISANLLASRVALYKKNYEECITYASKVIDVNSQVFDLSHNSIEFAQTRWGYGQGVHYFGINNENVLFLYGSNEYYTYSFLPGALALSDDIINTFEEGDLRFYYFSYVKGALGRAYFKFRPFPNRPGEPVRGFRVEEAYLNRAEAYAQLGMLDKAIADINTLRSFKFSSTFSEDEKYYEYSTSKFPTKNDLIKGVREERRRELFGEFHRWYDLRRYGMPEIVHQYNNETYVLHEGDPRYVLQIPQVELDFNPSMQKNPR